MSDRQLLEDAARSAGIKLVWLEGRPSYADSSLGNEWRPREDSGQALELAVKIGMNVACVTGHWTVVAAGFFDDSGDPAVEVEEPHGDDPMAATRRAIVRAAAALGKGMA